MGRCLNRETLRWATPRVEGQNDLQRETSETRHAGMDLSSEARLWQTPTSEERSNRGGERNGEVFLNRQAELWQTPSADSFRSRSGERSQEMGLDQQARFWPTPIEDNANNCGGPSRSRTDGYADLTVAVNRWPTTGANDHKGSAREGQRRGQLDEAAEMKFSRPGRTPSNGSESSATSRGSRRRLNPAFAAWLMGMPWWWTQPESIPFGQSAMESWRCRLRLRLSYLLGVSEFENGRSS
jgi:hypothetical protein